MLEILTRRRIIVFLFAILFVTLSLLFFGRIIPSYTNYPSIKPGDKQEISDCYLTEPVDVLTFCQKCTSYERRLNPNVCSSTGYKESVLCSKSNIHTSRSCQIPVSVQRQHFWLFEGFTLILGILAIASVQSRQKTLDRQMVEKIKRQIGESEE